MKFTEQLYKKTSKIYWHGSKYPEPSNLPWGAFFLTQDLEYALKFSDWQYLYQCHFDKPLDIFNARDRLDQLKLKKRLPDLSEEEINKTLELLKRDWLLLGIGGRQYLFKILRELGYDGFFNFESFDFPAIGVFDINSVKIDHVYYGDEIQNIIDKSKYKDKQKHQIDYYLSGGPAPEVSLIPKDILQASRKSLQEYIHDREEELAFLEEEYANDQSWYIQRRLSLYREKLEKLLHS